MSTTTEQMEPSATRSETTIESRLIDRSGNHRIDKLIDQDAIRGLEQTIAAGGLDYPILVAPHPDPDSGYEYAIIDGNCRLIAHDNLGYSRILARITEPMTWSQINAHRTICNVHRQGLNALEELNAVSAVLDSIDVALTESARIEAAANAIGKPVKWVADRFYLHRLAKPVRKLVEDGRLSLGHARIIAKLGDKHYQQLVADIVSAGRDGAGRMYTNAEVQRMVDQHSRSLRIVPWHLDVPYAGKPACSGCPDNTHSDPMLFEMPSDQAEKGTCLNAACFEKKKAKAEKDKRRALEKVQKRNVENPTAIDTIERVTPTGLKPATVQRFVKANLPGAGPGADVASPTGKAKKSNAHTSVEQPAQDPKQKALQEWRSALESWMLNTVDRVFHQCFVDGHQSRAALLLLIFSKASEGFYVLENYASQLNWNNITPATLPDCTAEQIKAIRAVGENDIATLEAGDFMDMDIYGLETQLSEWHPHALRRLAEAVGIEIDPLPLWQIKTKTPVKTKTPAHGKLVERHSISDLPGDIAAAVSVYYDSRQKAYIGFYGFNANDFDTLQGCKAQPTSDQAIASVCRELTLLLEALNLQSSLSNAQLQQSLDAVARFQQQRMSVVETKGKKK